MAVINAPQLVSISKREEEPKSTRPKHAIEIVGLEIAQ